MTQDIPVLMAPYRARIDEIDRQIVDLLRQRYDVIEEVGVFKFKHDIPATLQDRVDQVREQAAAMAADKGLDESLVRDLYARLIDHSCALEEEIKASLQLKKVS